MFAEGSAERDHIGITMGRAASVPATALASVS